MGGCVGDKHTSTSGNLWLVQEQQLDLQHSVLPPLSSLTFQLEDVSLKLIHGSSTFVLYVAHMSSKRFCAHTTLTQRWCYCWGMVHLNETPGSVLCVCQKDSEESYIHNRKMNKSPSIYLTYQGILQIITPFASEFCSSYFLQVCFLEVWIHWVLFPIRSRAPSLIQILTQCGDATLVAERASTKFTIIPQIPIANASLI